MHRVYLLSTPLFLDGSLRWRLSNLLCNLCSISHIFQGPYGALQWLMISCSSHQRPGRVRTAPNRLMDAMIAIFRVLDSHTWLYSSKVQISGVELACHLQHTGGGKFGTFQDLLLYLHLLPFTLLPASALWPASPSGACQSHSSLQPAATAQTRCKRPPTSHSGWVHLPIEEVASSELVFGSCCPRSSFRPLDKLASLLPGFRPVQRGARALNSLHPLDSRCRTLQRETVVPYADSQYSSISYPWYMLLICKQAQSYP